MESSGRPAQQPGASAGVGGEQARPVTATTTSPPQPPAPARWHTPESTYRATIGAAAPGDMARRCARARAETAVNRNAARLPSPALLSLATIDALRAAADAEVAAAAAAAPGQPGSSPAAAAAPPAEGAARAADAAAAAARARRASAEKATLVDAAVAARAPMRHAVVAEFFTPGSLDGPFPGAVSAHGAACAEMYWARVAAAAGDGGEGRSPGDWVAVRRTERHAPDGRRLTNHARL
jgi:hypothetical protein